MVRHYHKWQPISKGWLHCAGCDKWKTDQTRTAINQVFEKGL